MREWVKIRPVKALSETDVELQLDRAAYAIDTCYTKGLREAPGLTGAVVARFRVGLDGSVDRSSASGIGHDVAGCVARTVATLRFGKPAAAVRVSVKFLFDEHRYRFRRPPRRRHSRYRHHYPLRRRWRSVRRRIPANASRLHVGPVVVTAAGAKLRKLVRRTLHTRRRALRRCYRSVLLTTPSSRDRVTLRFRVTARGRARVLAVSGKHKRAAACLRRRVQQMVFPIGAAGKHYDVWVTLRLGK